MAERSLQLPLSSPPCHYSFAFNTLNRIPLDTGTIDKKYQSIKFNLFGNYFTIELPKGKVFLLNATDGKHFKIDTLRDLACTQEPDMNFPRSKFSALYFAGHLYVVGGFKSVAEAFCERYHTEERRWEVITPLPQACFGTALVALESTQSLYAFGGNDGENSIGLIQRLSLPTLEWEVLPIMIEPDCWMSAFKVDELQIYFVCWRRMFRYKPAKGNLKYIKTLPNEVSSIGGPTYHADNTLYCSGLNKSPKMVKISLSK